GVKGGLAAGLLFILPGVAVMLGLSILYAAYAELAFVEAIFFGIKAAVFAIVIDALIRISRRVMKTGALYAVAGAAFAAIFFLDVPFPVVVLGAAMFGLLAVRISPAVFGDALETREEAMAEGARGAISLPRTLVTLITGLALWLLPVVALLAAFGP